VRLSCSYRAGETARRKAKEIMTSTSSIIADAYAQTSNQTDAQRRVAILERKIAQGAREAVNVFQRLETEAPFDQIARSTALAFGYREVGKDVFEPTVDLDSGNQGLSDDTRAVTDYAVSQVAERAGIPGPYLRGLWTSKNPWERDLAVHALSKHFGEGQPNQRHLVRSAAGQVRGFLSDKFRRLDSRPLATALVEEARAVGAVPVDGVFTETRVALKIIRPEVVEVYPGEHVVLGGEWSNSDYGNGKNGYRAFVLRVMCLNGATLEDLISQVHLGGRLDERIEFSQRTYELDTRASVSALRDVVKGSLNPAKVDATIAGIRAAHEEKVDWARMGARFARILTKEEQKKAKELFEGDDVVNLPAGKSTWRASNALSWLAGQAEDAERRIDLERAAGLVLKAA
jgi:hypothetical protein